MLLLCLSMLLKHCHYEIFTMCSLQTLCKSTSMTVWFEYKQHTCKNIFYSSKLNANLYGLNEQTSSEVIVCAWMWTVKWSNSDSTVFHFTLDYSLCRTVFFKHVEKLSIFLRKKDSKTYVCFQSDVHRLPEKPILSSRL